MGLEKAIDMLFKGAFSVLFVPGAQAPCSKGEASRLSSSLFDFTDAKLRQFPQRGSEIKWIEYLGHGKEGIVCKATIGDEQTPVAIKVVRYLLPLSL